MHAFTAKLEIIGINPFVYVPPKVLKAVFAVAGRDKSPVPVCGKINGRPYNQTLVKYLGDWRLYINTSMLTNSPRRIGELVELTVEYDSADRTIPRHPELAKALSKNARARQIFEKLPPSTQKEISRYISNLKTAASVENNVKKAINFLLGKGRFVGRFLEKE